MPLETFTGLSVPRLLARAQSELGVDAVVVQVDRSRLPGGSTYFQLTAADAATAEDLGRTRESAPLTAMSGQRVSQSRSDRCVIAVVGPTGAGKTTTVIKLATHPDGLGEKKVGLLCLDTHRTGAVAQLQTVAKIWRLPLAVAYEPADMKRALRLLRRQDVILVDTPGRSSCNGDQMGVVNAMLHQLQPSEIHLVVPAGLSSVNVKRLMTTYRPAGVTHVLVTKLDEYPDDRCAFEIAAEALLPISWVTCGQRIPQDLRLVSNGPYLVANQKLNERQLGATAA